MKAGPYTEPESKRELTPAVETVKAVTNPLPGPLPQTIDQLGQTVGGACAQLPGGCP